MSMPVDINSMEISPLSSIKRVLDEKFKGEDWYRFELETIALEFGTIFTTLLSDKISILRILHTSHIQAYEDPSLFLYAAEVINNNPADFESVPHLTLLEAAYAIYSINKVLLANKVTITYPLAIQKACAYILNLEGASEPIAPFEFVPASELHPGQTAADTEAKKKAIAMYVKHMESL